MWTLKQTSHQLLQLEKKAYRATLPAPLDGMWDTALIPQANHWAILATDETVGYFCINDDRLLLQFYITADYLKWGQPIMAQIVAEGMAIGAFVNTHESTYLSLCIDHQKSVAIHSYLFQDFGPSQLAGQSIPDAHLTLATTPELEAIITFVYQQTEGDKQWLRTYLDDLIHKQQLYLLKLNDAIIGTGEWRLSPTQPPYVDVGMIVDRNHRNQGWATFILTQLKQVCYQQNLRPICSTNVDNIASRKAIEKAGFVTNNRLLHILFV
ncbi:MAG TPA: GNAT family N-acetyltransferase [Anaerolineae bacterium]|nr:GNAT family N-acetyltransferase [Anaerolineae bacterium]